MNYQDEDHIVLKDTDGTSHTFSIEQFDKTSQKSSILYTSSADKYHSFKHLNELRVTITSKIFKIRFFVFDQEECKYKTTEIKFSVDQSTSFQRWYSNVIKKNSQLKNIVQLFNFNSLVVHVHDDKSIKYVFYIDQYGKLILHSPSKYYHSFTKPRDLRVNIQSKEFEIAFEVFDKTNNKFETKKIKLPVDQSELFERWILNVITEKPHLKNIVHFITMDPFIVYDGNEKHSFYMEQEYLFGNKSSTLPANQFESIPCITLHSFPDKFEEFTTEHQLHVTITSNLIEFSFKKFDNSTKKFETKTIASSEPARADFERWYSNLPTFLKNVIYINASICLQDVHGTIYEFKVHKHYDQSFSFVMTIVSKPGTKQENWHNIFLCDENQLKVIEEETTFSIGYNVHDMHNQIKPFATKFNKLSKNFKQFEQLKNFKKKYIDTNPSLQRVIDVQHSSSTVPNESKLVTFSLRHEKTPMAPASESMTVRKDVREAYQVHF